MSKRKDEKILVCDDDNQFRQTVCKLLESEGYHVVAASSGKEAIEKAKELYYDLVVMDVRMPDIDGIETLKKIREIHGDHPTAIIVVTGFASEDAPIEALKLGASDYILKPFEMSDFLHSVNRNLEVVTALKDREYFYRRMLAKSEQLQLTENEIKELRKQLGEA